MPNEPIKHVSVSYIEGDMDGLFTDILCEELEMNSYFKYVNKSKQAYNLQVKIIALDDLNIGFKRRIENNEQKKNPLIATENRKQITIQIKMVDDCNNELFEPIKINEMIDYDYVDSESIEDLSFIDDSNKQEASLSFSLGQLNSYDSASKDSLRGLYKKISKKIVEMILLKIEKK